MNSKEQLLEKVHKLRLAHRQGLLGGEKMPEDENPQLRKNSRENYLYFTLPMALNYQRNSYTLWECAHRMYADSEARQVFDPKAVCHMPESLLREQLTRFRVALQPNRQPIIWKTLCETIETRFDGDIRNLFHENDFSVAAVKQYIAQSKKAFPYLGGEKICNYWLYVLEQYTDICFTDRENITVAPDTHVLQASLRLGLITPEEAQQPGRQTLTAQRWQELLAGTGLVPVDVHTPLWLWSRGKFRVEID